MDYGIAKSSSGGSLPATSVASAEMYSVAAGELAPPSARARQIERLNTLNPAVGERHDEANMAIVDR